MPFLTPFFGEGSPKIDKPDKNRVPTYANLSNLEDLVNDTPEATGACQVCPERVQVCTSGCLRRAAESSGARGLLACRLFFWGGELLKRGVS